MPPAGRQAPTSESRRRATECRKPNSLAGNSARARRCTPYQTGIALGNRSSCPPGTENAAASTWNRPISTSDGTSSSAIGHVPMPYEPRHAVSDADERDCPATGEVPTASPVLESARFCAPESMARLYLPLIARSNAPDMHSMARWQPSLESPAPRATLPPRCVTAAASSPSASRSA